MCLIIFKHMAPFYYILKIMHYYGFHCIVAMDVKNIIPMYKHSRNSFIGSISCLVMKYVRHHLFFFVCPFLDWGNGSEESTV